MKMLTRLTFQGTLKHAKYGLISVLDNVHLFYFHLYRWASRYMAALFFSRGKDGRRKPIIRAYL